MSRSLFSKATQSFLNASAIGQDRIIRKEVSLGAVREIPPPMQHMGLQFAPWLDVATDDVIFSYISADTDGLAPARAEDAESELAQKDDMVLSEGRASILDWALKDHYDASDVNKYRELTRIWQAMQNGELPLYVSSALEDWAAKFARDQARRRRKLDNRINWLIMTGLAANQISYNDGKIKFSVMYGRPDNQNYNNAANDLSAAGITNGVVDWSGTSHDPIGFIEAVQEFMFDTYGVRMNRILTSKKVTRRIVNSDKFSQRAGLGAAYNGSNQPVAPDLHYLLDGWGPDAAVQVVENATGIQFILDDSVYRTRDVGSKSIVNHRFFPEDEILFLPDTADLNEIDDTEIGFGRTLTSPHPEGNWSPGFYEWEDPTKDPWGQNVGNGVKAFPVFPHLDLTFAVKVTL